MSRLEEMFGYLPEFLGEFTELNKIITAEEPEFDLLWGNLEDIKKQLFIETATDSGLKRYESLLGIINTSTDLETRRAKVMALWFSDMPFTIKTLIQRLAVLQGNDKVDAWVINYLLHVKTDLVSAEEILSARKIIDSMIPANLGLQFDFESVFEHVCAFYGCAALYSTTTTLQVDDIDPDELTWLIDELEDTLTDELGIILFE